MIPFALLAAAACGAFAVFDVVRRPGSPFVAVRLPLAGVWSAAWFTYGLNATGFPAPGFRTLLALSATCLGTLLMCPRASELDVRHVVSPLQDRRMRQLTTGLGVLAVLLLTWDLYFIASLVSEHGWTAGLSQHRLDRGNKLGAWRLPGSEVLHAAVTAAGALGYGYWMLRRWKPALWLTFGGGLAALFATGRWDVVAYAIWLFAIHGFLAPRSPSLLAKQALVYAALPVFFVAHGQLLGKVDLATELANSTAVERASAAATAVPVIGGPAGAGAAPAAEPPDGIGALEPCPRWEQGLAEANRGFRDMSRVSRTIVLYLAGPMATLDRALCEGREAQRIVLAYWPRKVLRVLGIRPPEALLVVDPFLDIGIPFNNYTAIYPFLAEVGPTAGLVAWILFGLGVGVAWSAALRQGGISGIVAGSSILAMAIRTPWVNTFFDGTLLVWVVIAALPALLAGVRQGR